MAKVSHKQRIIDLIELNKSDVEIKKTIYNEYNIVIKLSDIEAKRNNNYILDLKVIKNQNIDDKIKLVKEVLNDNCLNPLTKKELVNEIRLKHHVSLTPIEIKEILWSKLRNQIIYDKNEWTYRLKNKIKNEIVEIEKPTLNKYLKNSISKIIEELYGKIKFSQTLEFSEEFLFCKNKDIHEFEINNEINFDQLKKIVFQNYNLLKKIYNIIQNLPKIVSYKNEIIENVGNINEFDLNNFTNTFNNLFEVDDEKIRIKNNFYFNQTKDELEFLFEAFEKFHFSLVNTSENPNNKISILTNEHVINKNDSIEENVKINDILNELNKSLISINLIFDLIKNSKNNDEILFNLEKLLNESKKINYILNKEKDKSLDLNVVLNIISEEKYRIGKSDANLLAENITFRLKNNLWD